MQRKYIFYDVIKVLNLDYAEIKILYLFILLILLCLVNIFIYEYNINTFIALQIKNLVKN